MGAMRPLPATAELKLHPSCFPLTVVLQLKKKKLTTITQLFIFYFFPLNVTLHRKFQLIHKEPVKLQCIEAKVGTAVPCWEEPPLCRKWKWRWSGLDPPSRIYCGGDGLASNRDEEKNLHSPNIFISTESIQHQAICRWVWDMDSFGGNYPKLGLTEKYQYRARSGRGQMQSLTVSIKNMLQQPVYRFLITVFLNYYYF